MLFLSLFFSCNKQELDNDFGEIHLRDKYLNKYFGGYSEVYKEANFTINKWIKDSLSNTKSAFWGNWKLDSVFIFNKKLNCLFGVVVFKEDKYKDGVADYLSLFAGRKINNKWYFFFSGSHLVLPREGMQYNFYDSFSYEELSYLAYDQEFRNYIKNILNGKSNRNEKRFINDYSDIQECPKKNKKLDWKCIDSLIVKVDEIQYKYKLTKKEIAKIQKDMDESIKPPYPVLEIKEWWQFWKKEPKVPLFESEEWENYLKKKYGNDWEKHK